MKTKILRNPIRIKVVKILKEYNACYKEEFLGKVYRENGILIFTGEPKIEAYELDELKEKLFEAYKQKFTYKNERSEKIKKKNRETQIIFRKENPYYNGYMQYQKRYNKYCKENPNYSFENPKIQYEEYIALREKQVLGRGVKIKKFI